MNGRRDDDERGAVNGSPSAASGSDALERDLLAQVLREEPDLATAVEALPAALDPVDLPAGAWERLTAALVDLGPTGHAPAIGAVPAAAAELAREPTPEPAPDYVPVQNARPGRVPLPGWRYGTSGGPSGGPRPRWNWAHPFTWLSAAAVAAVVIGLGTWGALQAGERTRLVDEQRVLAYWMANPVLRMVSLQEIGSSAESGGGGASGRLGVVCILPDGRALLLQPTPAGRGQSYVVVGGQTDANAPQTVLASGRGNVIRFDLAGSERVVVMLASGDGERVPIAWAAVN